MLPCASLAIALTGSAMAATSDADKCEATKNKAAGSYYSCLEKAVATGITKGASPDYSKCDDKFTSSWDKAETKGEGACPDNVLTDALRGFLFSQQSVVAPIVAGDAGVPICGDGIVNVVGEQCDGADLGGASCDSLSHDYGTLGCNSSCDFDASACGDCPPGTTPIDGSCWLLAGSTTNRSCTATCQAIGLTCNVSALVTVGSGGTDEACKEIIDVVGPAGPYPINENSPDTTTECGTDSSGAGCTMVTDPIGHDTFVFRRTGTVTTCEADLDSEFCSATGNRACACR
jgi:hypothetical protein